MTAPYTFLPKDSDPIPCSGLGEVYGLFVEYGNTPAEALALCAQLAVQSINASGK